METTLLLPAEFAALDTCVCQDSIVIHLTFTATVGHCPLCHCPSSRLHSFYRRTPTDLPICGKRVCLQLYSRKFFCDQAGCPRKVFAQQAAGQLKPYGRRLERAREQVLAISLELGARPGARICHLVGLPVSASTVLRVLKSAPVPDLVTPRVLGVDDFSFRKRVRYGTILVDLEKHQPVDLLPDREGPTLERWLRDHPGITIVSRDRSSVYGQAITNACPRARQVADRWHLLKNLSENTARYLDSNWTLLKDAAQELDPPARPAMAEAVQPPKPAPKPKKEKRQAIFQQVKQLQQQGHSRRSIARHLGISRNMVNLYFKQEEYVPRAHHKRSNLLDFEAHLRQRWQEGEQCGKTLLKEIQALGYTGSYTILTELLATYPRDGHRKSTGLSPAHGALTLTTCHLGVALCQQEQEWREKGKPFLRKLLEKSPMLEQVWELNLEFKQMLEHKKEECLEDWCQRAASCSCFRSFVRGIRQDFEAVREAMRSQWSNGQVEGQVNRLKTIKRQMYGRAGFELLRIRVLAKSP